MRQGHAHSSWMTDAAHAGLHGELPHKVARFGFGDLVADIADVFKGAGEQLVDTVSGVVDSVTNPIDFLATGTAEQLGTIIDYCEHKFDQIDAMVVVFGSPGLFDVANVYAVISEKLKT